MLAGLWFAAYPFPVSPVMISFLPVQVEVDQPVQLTPGSRAKHEAELLMLFSRHDEDGDGKMKVDAG